MKKTSVYLDQEHVWTLKRIAEAQGISQAEVLRDAILHYAETALAKPDRNFAIFALDGLVEGPGGSIADLPEEELLRGFGDDADPRYGTDSRR